MTGWLLDTNVISEFKRPRPNTDVTNWIAGLDRGDLYTTTVNIAEIRLGIVSETRIERRQGLQTWLIENVLPLFDDRVLAATEDAFLRWFVLADRGARSGRPAEAVDLLIAAIADLNRVAVATRDIKPFVSVGIPVLNPWTGERFNGA
jgi:hypothetical protein